MQDACDEVNLLIGEWNDIVMEDYYIKEKPEYCERENPVSVNGQLVYGYKDDPKSW